jgi:hypothetical protein
MMEEFEQMSLTEASFEPYRIKNKIRLIELFGGIGAQAKDDKVVFFFEKKGIKV